MTTDLIRKVAADAATKYARQCYWADRRELEQEALAALYDARRRFDPLRGRAEPYAWATAVQAIRRWLWSFSASVKQTRGSTEVLSDAPLSHDIACRRVRPDEALEVKQILVKGLEVLAPFPLGAKVILGERSAEVAKEARVPVGEVYSETGRARDALRRHAWEGA